MRIVVSLTAPKESHARAIVRIARYWKWMKEKGFTIRPTEGRMILDYYVDTNYCGLFGYEDAQDPVCVRFISGWVFTLGGNPIHFALKLQITTACQRWRLSSLHCPVV